MLTEDFAELFQGRRDAYGSGAVAGACIRVSDPNDWNVHIWPYHLNGNRPIGIYPVVNQNLCHWGVVDFDIKSEAHRSWDYESEDEAHLAAVNLQSVCRHLGATAWIERTRSSGRHVWVFADSWCSASVMRRALLVACSVAGVSTREVNPKSETLAEGQLGNYVRLPYPGALKNLGLFDAQQYIIFPGEAQHIALGLQSFVRDALAARTSPHVLERIAAKWKAQEPEHIGVDWDDAMDLVEAHLLVHRLNKTGQSVFTHGPNDGDRSRGMVYLARQAKVSGFTPSEALTLLRGAHWNKYRNRADEEKQLRDIVERAWT